MTNQLEATRVPQNKPQGFEVGQLANQGVHSCLWDCGRVFPTQGEAQCHQPCVGREESDRTIEKMYSLRGLPVDFFHFNKKEKERSNMILDKLPQLDREDLVEKWIIASPFPTTWVYNNPNHVN